MNELINQIASFIEQNEKKLIIGISGHGASGKTTLVKNLCKSFDSDSIEVINTDAYIISSKYRNDVTIRYQYKDIEYLEKPTACMPLAHELNSLERDIKILKDDKKLITIDQPWSRSREINGNKKVIFIEGMSLAFLECHLFDLSIFLYTDSDTELKRRLERDVKVRNADSQDIINSHGRRRRQFEIFMLPHSKRFDIVMSNEIFD